ncbi:MAG TPA: MerR family transcriptional regulator [Bryobacteraceae bacterium]|nr:MerR family transcriptional regulator [Bryobacteraceae bacterium]
MTGGMSEAVATSNAPEIPDKLFFRIGEVSTMLGLEPYVLRYWETEFPSLSPKKSGTGHRLYRRKDVELLLRIKHLLYEKRFTIDGARQHLHDEARSLHQKDIKQEQQALFSDPVPEIRRELAEILKLLR